MPLDTGAGWNAEDTPRKQAHLRYVFGWHMNVVERMLRKHTWATQEYLYLDLTAGPGRYAELPDLQGSPLVFLDAAASRSFASRGYFFEQNTEALASLNWEVFNHETPWQVQANIIAGNHDATLPRILSHLRPTARNRYGLAYADPNGTRPPVEALRSIAQQFPRVDLLLYVAATTYKRVRGAQFDDAYLSDDLAALGKDVWCIREPHGRHQWTMLLGSNWPDMKALRQAEFWRLDSREGQAILGRLNLSAKERQAQEQYALPLAETRPTAPMPSIYATPASAPSVLRSWLEPPDAASAVASVRRPNRTTCAIRPGARLTYPAISWLSAIPATVPSTASRTEEDRDASSD